MRFADGIDIIRNRISSDSLGGPMFHTVRMGMIRYRLASLGYQRKILVFSAK